MRLSFFLGAALVCSLVACGGSSTSPSPTPLADAAPDAPPSDGGAEATVPDSGMPEASPSNDASDDAFSEAPDDGEAAADADATADPCADLEAEVAHCASLVGTKGISGADVDACIDAMSALRASPSCATEAQRASFDGIALAVLESALSLSPPSCDATSLRPSLEWMQRYVQTARALAQPAEPVTHATLAAIDDAFWDGLYWGDPRASAFNRVTLRSISTDPITCDEAVIEAALVPAAAGAALPLTTAPLANVVGEALAGFGEGYDRTTYAHEFACGFVACASPDLPSAAQAWAALASLADASALQAAIGDAGLPAGAATLPFFAMQHAVFEGAVEDALGVTTYSPTLLSGASASDLPDFGALAATIANASALVAAYASTGSYFGGPANDLHDFPLDDNYYDALNTQLDTTDDRLTAAQSNLATAKQSFQAGSAASYDATDLESTQRSALQWALANVPPIVALRLPETTADLAKDDNSLQVLAALADTPVSYGALSFYAPDALGEAVNAVGFAALDSPDDEVEKVSVSFANPYHTTQPSDSPNPWLQVDSTRAKAVWDAIVAGGTATITLQPSDLYSYDGGAATLVCTEGATVLRAIALQFEYPSGAAIPAGDFDLPYQVAAGPEPYVTSAAELESFTSPGAATASSLAVVFADESAGWSAESELTTGGGNGISPLAPLTIDFAPLSATLGSATGPRSLTLMMLIDTAPTSGSMSWISACVGP